MDKKYHKVIIVNDNNEWVATEGNCTLHEAVEAYKKEDKAELSYDKKLEYYAFGVDSTDDSEYFGEEEDEVQLV